MKISCLCLHFKFIFAHAPETSEEEGDVYTVVLASSTESQHGFGINEISAPTGCKGVSQSVFPKYTVFTGACDVR